MCCTSIAPCWEQPALWGNICTLSLTQECFKHLHSLPPLELSSCSLLPPPRRRILFSFLDPPIPTKFFGCPCQMHFSLTQCSCAPSAFQFSLPRESSAGHPMQHYACCFFLYLLEEVVEITSFMQTHLASAGRRSSSLLS